MPNVDEVIIVVNKNETARQVYWSYTNYDDSICCQMSRLSYRRATREMYGYSINGVDGQQLI